MHTSVRQPGAFHTGSELAQIARYLLKSRGIQNKGAGNTARKSGSDGINTPVELLYCFYFFFVFVHLYLYYFSLSPNFYNLVM